MGPAEVFWLSRLSTGTFSFEDRINLGGHFPPQCYVNQYSTVLKSDIAKDGTLSATWTRPLILNEPKYADIIEGNTVTVIAAWGNQTNASSSSCVGANVAWSQHTFVGTSDIQF